LSIALLASPQRLRIGHYLILTTEPLCKRLQSEYCEWSCAWTTLWHDHPGLPAWNLKPGDMFLMWAQQWRYIAMSMALNYRVLRSDTDVYLAEDPYPILRGPLFRRFEMVVQHDFFGARERPRCDRSPGLVRTNAEVLPSCGTRHQGLALLNIGLVYLRSTAGGGVHAVINTTWTRFLERLSGPPSKPAHLRGGVDSQALIDQCERMPASSRRRPAMPPRPSCSVTTPPHRPAHLPRCSPATPPPCRALTARGAWPLPCVQAVHAVRGQRPRCVCTRLCASQACRPVGRGSGHSPRRERVRRRQRVRARRRRRVRGRRRRASQDRFPRASSARAAWSPA
jgi:hypothetical protein